MTLFILGRKALSDLRQHIGIQLMTTMVVSVSILIFVFFALICFNLQHFVVENPKLVFKKVNFSKYLVYGKPVGTAFIIGDSEAVLQKSHQLILNPLEGHPTEVRLITKMENWETIKELAQLDGAFVVDKEGVVLSAGRYIDMKMKSVGTLPKGFGTRHNAATAITKKTKAIAVILSKSGGEVRVFKDGEVIYRTPPLQMISYKSKKEPA